MNVSNDNSAENVTFDIDGPNSEIKRMEGVSSNEFVTYEFTAGSSNSGTYDISVNDSTGASDSITNIIIDREDPDLDSNSPTGYIKDDSPDVSFTASDTHTSVNTSTYQLWVEDSSGNLEDNQSSSSYSLNDLGDDTYTVYYSVEDEVGNKLSSNWDFTVDTSYDVADPSYDWKSTENNEVVKMDDDVTVVLNFDEDDEEPEQVGCYDGDADISDNEFMEADDIDDSDGQYKFACDFEEDDYAGETVDFQIKAEDRAGNSKTYEVGEFSFDTDDPTVSDLSTAVATVQGDFSVGFESSDDTGVEELEYFVDDESTLFGEGTSAEADQNSFTVSVEDLDPGEHTLYVRARDAVDRWSDTKELDFSYLPNADPEVTMDTPSEVEVTAGETQEVDVTVNNTGKIIIRETNLTVSGLTSYSETLTNMMPGDTEEVSFDISPGEADIGEKSVTVSISDPSVSEDIPVRVKANSNQINQIETSLTDYESKLSDLESKVTELQSKGLNEDLSGRLDSNFSEFKSKVEKARSQADAGNYYKAQSTLEGIDSTYSSAESSYENVEKIKKRNNRNFMIFTSLGVLLLLGIGGGGFYVYRTGTEFGEVESKLGLDNLKEKLASITESEPEAEEFEWDGFS